MIVDRKIFFSLLCFLIIIKKLQAIYKAPTVFYSRRLFIKVRGLSCWPNNVII